VYQEKKVVKCIPFHFKHSFCINGKKEGRKPDHWNMNTLKEKKKPET